MLPSFEIAPLPSSIEFLPDFTFRVEKCSSATYLDDPDCAFAWVDTTYRIVIKAVLDDLSSTQDASVFFDVTIFNDCANDSILFNAQPPSP